MGATRTVDDLEEDGFASSLYTIFCRYEYLGGARSISRSSRRAYTGGRGCRGSGAAERERRSTRLAFRSTRARARVLLFLFSSRILCKSVLARYLRNVPVFRPRENNIATRARASRRKEKESRHEKAAAVLFEVGGRSSSNNRFSLSLIRFH